MYILVLYVDKIVVAKTNNRVLLVVPTCYIIKQSKVFISLQVIMGGGRSKFLPNNSVDEQKKSGQRVDNRNLIKEWLNIDRISRSRNAYVGDRSQLKSLNKKETDYLLGK